MLKVRKLLRTQIGFWSKNLTVWEIVSLIGGLVERAFAIFISWPGSIPSLEYFLTLSLLNLAAAFLLQDWPVTSVVFSGRENSWRITWLYDCFEISVTLIAGSLDLAVAGLNRFRICFFYTCFFDTDSQKV